METESKIRKKIYAFCAYQERSPYEVKKKLCELKATKPLVEKLMMELYQENFINEERFAKSYVRGKFRHCGWGKKKIVNGLLRHCVSKKNIEIAMLEIEEEEYQRQLQEFASKKWLETREKSKVYRYLAGKGYENDEIVAILEVFKN